MAGKKHKHITFATRNEPGYNPPSAPTSKKGGGYPHKQLPLFSKNHSKRKSK